MLSERPKASAVAVCGVSGWVWSVVGAGTDFGERFGREPGNSGRNGGSEPLEVDCRRSQDSLDAHVVEELGPDRLRLGCADLQAQHLAP